MMFLENQKCILSLELFHSCYLNCPFVKLFTQLLVSSPNSWDVREVKENKMIKVLTKLNVKILLYKIP